MAIPISQQHQFKEIKEVGNKHFDSDVHSERSLGIFFSQNHLGVSSEEYRSMEYRRSEYRRVQKAAQVDIWVLSLFEPSQISPYTSPDHQTPSCDFAQGSSSHHQSTPLSLDKVQSTLLLTFVHLLFMCCYARFFLVLCSKIFCQACTAKTCKLAASKKPVRVCDKCHDELTK